MSTQHSSWADCKGAVCTFLIIGQLSTRRVHRLRLDQPALICTNSQQLPGPILAARALRQGCLGAAAAVHHQRGFPSAKGTFRQPMRIPTQLSKFFSELHWEHMRFVMNPGNVYLLTLWKISALTWNVGQIMESSKRKHPPHIYSDL